MRNLHKENSLSYNIFSIFRANIPQDSHAKVQLFDLKSSWLLITIMIQFQLLQVLSAPICAAVLRNITQYVNTCTFQCRHKANENVDSITITPGPGTTILGTECRIKSTSQ